MARLILALLVALSLAAPSLAQWKKRPLKHPPFGVAQKNIFMRCDEARVVDGDTLHCKSGYHLRLLGIDAPELKCRKDQPCGPAEAVAARESLVLGMTLGPLSYQYIRRDNHGRPVVIVRAGDLNLSCWQLSRTTSALHFDHRGRTAKECWDRTGTENAPIGL